MAGDGESGAQQPALPTTGQHYPALLLVSGRNLVAAGHWAAVWAPLVRPGHRAPGLQSAHTNLPLLYSGVEIRP